MDSGEAASSSSAIKREEIKQNLKSVRAEVLQQAIKNAGNSKDYKEYELHGATEGKLLKKKRKKKEKKKSHSKSKSKSKSKPKSKSKSKSKTKSVKKSKHKSKESKESKGRNKASKSKPKSKSKRKRKRARSSSSDTSTYELLSSEQSENEECVEALQTKSAPAQRESWMTNPVMFKTFSRECTQSQQYQQQRLQQQANVYCPISNAKELNPYWRSTGTGLPPSLHIQISEVERTLKKPYPVYYPSTGTSSNNWCKRKMTPKYNGNQSEEPNPTIYVVESAEVSELRSSISQIDHQMNELAANIIKAEIMNNQTLAADLKAKLHKARSQRKLVNYNLARAMSTSEQHVVLSHTDAKGNSRPIAPYVHQRPSANDSYDSGHSRKKLKTMPTHENGIRQRYYADDDKFDLKQMFEKEKYTSVSDNNRNFAAIASNSNKKNGKDDLDDIFMEKICKDDSKRLERRDIREAIRDNRYLERIMNSCDKCLASTKIKKELIIAIGKKVYLSLPRFVGLQAGHCILSTHYHIACSTQLDEDVLQELTEFRQAIANMFSAQQMDVIFFEMAKKLHRKPHLAIHCIPVKESDGELAPLYFKKAIEESELEWSINKQLIPLRCRPLSRCIPRGLPYFWVNFGMQSGFAHVIEDEDRFPSHFAEEIIAGILQLNAEKWRKLRKDKNVKANVTSFVELWKKYDCTQSKTDYSTSCKNYASME